MGDCCPGADIIHLICHSCPLLGEVVWDGYLEYLNIIMITFIFLIIEMVTFVFIYVEHTTFLRQNQYPHINIRTCQEPPPHSHPPPCHCALSCAASPCRRRGGNAPWLPLIWPKHTEDITIYQIYLICIYLMVKFTWPLIFHLRLHHEVCYGRYSSTIL